MILYSFSYFGVVSGNYRSFLSRQDHTSCTRAGCSLPFECFGVSISKAIASVVQLFPYGTSPSLTSKPRLTLTTETHSLLLFSHRMPCQGLNRKPVFFWLKAKYGDCLPHRSKHRKSQGARHHHPITRELK